MSEVPSPTPGDDAELGALLVLLNGAADSFRTVQVTYRTWRHEHLLRKAFRANVEKQKRRASGARVSDFAKSITVDGETAPTASSTARGGGPGASRWAL